MKMNRNLFAVLLAGVVGARTEAQAKDNTVNPVNAPSAPTRLAVEGHFPSLAGATGWLNSQPLNSTDLRGKVVLVDIWTYTCVNWRRTLPYVRAWAEKYKDRGLVVIGVHTPEFSLEKDVGNIRQAIKEMRIEYPVAIDSDYAVWRAFSNEYWPALYLIDAQGRIRYHHFGEGEYEQSERVIQQLLAESGGSVSHDLVTVHPQGAEVAADSATLKSPESYIGYEQARNFASPGGAISDRSRDYAAPSRLNLNQWALSGSWTIGKEAAVLNNAGGRVLYRFHARDVNLIMGPETRGTSARFRVRIDGKAPGPSHGADVDEQGNGTLTEQRLYQLIRQSGTIMDRLFEIEFLDPGVQALDFTFG